MANFEGTRGSPLRRNNGGGDMKLTNKRNVGRARGPFVGRGRRQLSHRVRERQLESVSRHAHDPEELEVVMFGLGIRRERKTVAETGF